MTKMNHKQVLAKVRKLLGSKEQEGVELAIFLVENLGIEFVNKHIFSGVSISADGQLQIGEDSEIRKRCRKPFRAFAALRILEIRDQLCKH